MEKDEIERLMKNVQTPVDTEALENSGAIRKAGDWWEVVDFSKITDHAKQQMSEIDQTVGKPLKVKFFKRTAGKRQPLATHEQEMDREEIDYSTEPPK